MPSSLSIVKNISRAAAVALAIALCSLAFAAVAVPQRAFADEGVCTINAFTDAAGKQSMLPDKAAVTVTDVSAAVDAINDLTGNSLVKCVQVDLSCDWNTKGAGRIVVAQGKVLKLNLHGHMINRAKAGSYGSPWYAEGEGEVIHVKKGATLNVDGGTGSEANTEHRGTVSDNNHWWRYDGTGDTVLKGGLITGGACDDKYGAGGIAASGKGTTVNLTNVTVAGNLTDQWDSSYGHGAGVAIHGNDSSLTVKNSKIIYNHAEGYGGGIYVREDGTSVMIQTGSEVSNNLGVLDGGGIYIDDDSVELKIENSKVNGNATHDNGGGIYSKGSGLVQLWGAECKYNSAEDNGGGIYYGANSGSMIIRSASYVSDNTAGANGGGIYHNGKNGYVNIYGGSYVSSNNAVNGAGIYTNYDGTSFTFTGAYLNSNKASQYGGGLYANDVVKLTVEDSSQVNGNEAVLDGGGVLTDDACTIKVSASTVSSNKAGHDGGGFALGKYSYRWPYEDKSIYLCKGASVSYNEAGSTYGGGGIFVKKDEPTISSDGTGVVEYNTAGYGAGIWAEPQTDWPTSEDLTVKDVTFRYNTASVAGGGMYLAGSSILSNVTVTGNRSDCGAGIHVGIQESSDVVFQKKITVTGNTFIKSGGASNIWLGKNSYSTIQTIKGGSGADAVTADSRFGITVDGWPGYERKIIEGDDFFTNLKDDKWKDVVFADWSEKFDVKYSLEEGTFSDTPCLYTMIKEDEPSKEESKVAVSIYGNMDGSGSGDPVIRRVDKGELVMLATSSYKKVVEIAGAEVGCPLVSWTLKYKDGTTSTLKPDRNLGITKFSPSQDVSAYANYAQAVVGVSATLDDNRTWDDLADSSNLSVSRVTFTTSDGQIRELSEKQLEGVTASTAVTEDAKKVKRVACSVTVPKETVEAVTGSAVLTSESMLKIKSALYSSTMLGSYSGKDVKASIKAYDDCTLTLTFTVDIQGDYTVSFDSDGGEQSYAAQKVKPGGTATYPGNVQKKGYVFQGWKLKDASADAAGDAAEAAVASTADAATVTDGGSDAEGLYDFQTPVTGDIALIAAWDKADDEEYIDPDEDKPDEKVDPDADDDIDDDDDDIDDDDDDDGDDYFEYAASADVALPAIAEGAELPSKATASLCDSRGRVLASVSASLSWRKADGTALSEGARAQAGERYVVEAVIPRSANPYVYPYSRTSVTFNGQAAASKSGPDGAWRLSATFEVAATGAFEGATLTLPKGSYAYTGSTIEPAVTVAAYGRKLAEGTDYTVSYGANTAVGQAVVTVTGTGAYSGQMSASFSIVPAKVTGLAARAVKAKGKVRLAWDRRSAQTAGFEVCWATSKARLAKGKYAGTRTVKKASAKSCAAKGLKGGKRYWFKVRAYKVVGGRCYLSAWSKVRSAKAR